MSRNVQMKGDAGGRSWTMYAKARRPFTWPAAGDGAAAGRDVAGEAGPVGHKLGASMRKWASPRWATVIRLILRGGISGFTL